MPEYEDLENVGWRAFEGLLDTLEKKNPGRVKRARKVLRDLIGPGPKGESPSGAYFLYQVLETEEKVTSGTSAPETMRHELLKLTDEFLRVAKRAREESGRTSYMLDGARHRGRSVAYADAALRIEKLANQINSK